MITSREQRPCVPRGAPTRPLMRYESRPHHHFMKLSAPPKRLLPIHGAHTAEPPWPLQAAGAPLPHASPPRGLTPGQKRQPGLPLMPLWATPAVRRPLLHEALLLALTSWPFLPEGVQTGREAGCPKGVNKHRLWGQKQQPSNLPNAHFPATAREGYFHAPCLWRLVCTRELMTIMLIPRGGERLSVITCVKYLGRRSWPRGAGH